MKKIQINAGKLHLTKEKIANLTPGEMSKVIGGYDFVEADKRGSRSGRGCLCCTGCCFGDVYNGQPVGQLLPDGSPVAFDAPEYPDHSMYPYWPVGFTQG